MPKTSYTAVLLNPRDLVVEAAKRLGLSMVICPAPEAPEPEGAPGPVLRSPWTTDVDGLVERLRELGLPAPVTCFGFGELGCSVSAVVNERMGWPGSRPAPHALFRDKAALRTAVGARAGRPVAHAVCRTAGEIRAAVARLGYPCVVKPVDGTGSAGVRLHTGPADTEAHLAELEPGRVQLVEEFLTGVEYSVEALTSPRGHRILAITEKQTTGAPHFVETGHTLPVRLDDVAEKAITELVTATLDAAGYDFGVSHTEVMLTSDGPRLIESHGRPGGDRISDMLILALDEDVFEQAMAAVVDVPPPTVPGRHRVAGIRYVTFDRGHPLPALDLSPVEAMAGVAEVTVSVPPGEVPPEVRRSADRHGFVVAVGDNRTELEARLTAAVAALEELVTAAGQAPGGPGGPATR
ncbi:ATP-grasp domain-containing protein [Amycolatopsis sp. H6(2020)]|nr:ATP-grasp domain-containing protein [Amycolatopsis sp. H6(2020)]